MKRNFDAAGWFAALCRAVEARRVNWQQVSEATGVSATTLSRMKAGQPDAASLAALSAWAGLNPAEFCPKVPPQRITCPTCHGAGTVLERAAGTPVEAQNREEALHTAGAAGPLGDPAVRGDGVPTHEAQSKVIGYYNLNTHAFMDAEQFKLMRAATVGRVSDAWTAVVAAAGVPTPHRDQQEKP